MKKKGMKKGKAITARFLQGFLIQDKKRGEENAE
jgi:hypothetical protein